MATTRTERSTKALHNFTMPGELRWGNQKHLRCMKVNSDGRIAPFRRLAAVDSFPPDQQRRRENPAQHRRDGGGGRREGGPTFEFVRGSRRASLSPPGAAQRFGDGDDGIAAVREKVMFDLQAAADRMKHAIFKDGLEEGEVSGSPSRPPPAAASVDGEIHRPWNLRTRRAACKTPARKLNSSPTHNAAAAAASGGGIENDSAGEKDLTVDAPKPKPGFTQTKAAGSAADKSVRLRSSGGAAAAAIGEKRERPKFSVALSKADIEEDFMAMVGHRPARRPKKRARNVQRQLDTLFPGLWLTEVTPDMYKVSEAAP